jgi:hypothetical protein
MQRDVNAEIIAIGTDLLGEITDTNRFYRPYPARCGVNVYFMI